MRRRAWPLATDHPEQGDRCEHVLQLSPSAPAAWTADITMEKRFVLKIVSLSLVLCKSHQDDDDGGHSAGLDAE